jgi:hypothetical protein
MGKGITVEQTGKIFIPEVIPLHLLSTHYFCVLDLVGFGASALGASSAKAANEVARTRTASSFFMVSGTPWATASGRQRDAASTG